MLLQRVDTRRPGMILLVIVAFLALFTIMGITYLLYADSQLRNSIDEIKRLDKRDYRALAEIDTTFLLNFFLERFIYDQPDYEPDVFAVATGGINYEPRSVFSGLRGHSLARNMYGFNYQPPSTAGLNDRPFSGTGKLARNISIPGTGVTLPENQILNYTFFKSFGQTQILDPERGPRTSLTTLAPNSSSWNAPYTYPDFNNLYLAWLKPDGKIGKPSFHLDSVFGKMDLASRATNPNWLNQQGRYMTLRPRPVDNLVPADYAATGGDPVQLAAIVNQRLNEQNLFPYPDEFGYDVKNLETYPDNNPLIGDRNDSIWIDVGSPVFYNIDGRKYKILVAPLVIDLDGRVNLNYSGNSMAVGSAHGSNQGWGTWEINPNRLNPNLLSYYPFRLSGTVGTSFPVSPTSPVDFNGSSEPGVTGRLGGPLYPRQTSSPPATESVNQFESFVNFPAKNFGNLTGELTAHISSLPLLNWINIPYSYADANQSELRNLLRWRGRGSDPTASKIVNTAAGSTMVTSFGTSFTDPNVDPTWNLKTALTSISAGLARPAFVPYFVNGTANPFQMPNGAFYPKPSNPDSYNAPPTPPTGPGSISDFNSNRVTSEAATLMGINLNRLLTPYPSHDINPFNGTPSADGPGRIASGNLGNVRTCNQERQVFAREIFQALVKITGVRDMSPATVAIPSATTYDPDFEANRYLAQLAVNLVDYLDNDNISTNFVWKYDPAFSSMPGGVVPSTTDPAFWSDSNPRSNPSINDQRVYGVELNKLLVNEVYAEIQNDPSDTFPEMPAMSGMRPASKPFQVNFWVELMNPLPNDPSFKEFLEQNPRGTAHDSPVYQIRVFDLLATDPSLKVFDSNNSSGTPDSGVTPRCSVNDFTVDSSTQLPGGSTLADYENSDQTKVIIGSGANYANPTCLSNQGFMVISSPTDFPGSGAVGYAGISDLKQIANIRTGSLRYTIPQTTAGFENASISTTIANRKHCVVLQRLANPYLAPQPNPQVGDYNPYITVDVFDDVKLNDAVTNDKEKMRTPTAVKDRASTMRRQPYQDSRKTQTNSLKVEGGAPYSAMPQHTFMRHNGEQNSLSLTDTDSLLELPFTPILHLDRQIINSLELLNLAGCKPGELTRRFMNENSPGKGASPFKTNQSTPVFYGHKVPWSDDSNRLSRFFELANPLNRINGSRVAAREFGKININTVWHPEIFNALADVGNTASDNMNGFIQNEVYDGTNGVFVNMRNSRSPSGSPSPVGGGDKPFWGLGLGGSSGGDDFTSGPRGLENTVLRSSCFDLPLTDSVGNRRSEYQRKELLSKIFNNITTKSNVFAVWLTVGYFEVTDDSTQPPKLGTEMGLREGTSIRPKMFAIIDRTNIIAARNFTGSPPSRSPLPDLVSGIDIDLESAGVGTFRLYDVRNTSNLIALQDGMSITFDPNLPNEETVIIRRFNALGDPRDGHFVANFTFPHSGLYYAVIRGNPGPWTNFSIDDCISRSPGVILNSDIYAER